jgi:hypothetical protein
MSNEKGLFYDQPPTYQQPEVAAAGNRIPASSEQELNLEFFGPAAAQDLGGQPVWVVSALLKYARAYLDGAMLRGRAQG